MGLTLDKCCDTDCGNFKQRQDPETPSVARIRPQEYQSAKN